jgi:hypothetical protein
MKRLRRGTTQRHGGFSAGVFSNKALAFRFRTQPNPSRKPSTQAPPQKVAISRASAIERLILSLLVEFIPSYRIPYR